MGLFFFAYFTLTIMKTNIKGGIIMWFGIGNLIVLNDDRNVGEIAKVASNYGLVCKHKIGIYDDVEQHEVYVIGSYSKRKKFFDELAPGTYKCWF